MIQLYGENDRIAKKVDVGECAGSRSVGSTWKRWIDTVKDYLRKRSLYVSQARRMVQNRSECKGFCEVECMGRTLEMKP